MTFIIPPFDPHLCPAGQREILKKHTPYQQSRIYRAWLPELEAQNFSTGKLRALRLALDTSTGYTLAQAASLTDLAISDLDLTPQELDFIPLQTLANLAPALPRERHALIAGAHWRASAALRPVPVSNEAVDRFLSPEVLGTEEGAYLLGRVINDIALRPDGQTLELMEQVKKPNRSLLVRLANILGVPTQSANATGSRKDLLALRLNSSHFHSKLTSLGLLNRDPNPTPSPIFDLVPDASHSHLLRGLWESRGSLSIKSHGIATLSFTGALPLQLAISQYLFSQGHGKHIPVIYARAAARAPGYELNIQNNHRTAHILQSLYSTSSPTLALPARQEIALEVIQKIKDLQQGKINRSQLSRKKTHAQRSCLGILPPLDPRLKPESVQALDKGRHFLRAMAAHAQVTSGGSWASSSALLMALAKVSTTWSEATSPTLTRHELVQFCSSTFNQNPPQSQASKIFESFEAMGLMIRNADNKEAIQRETNYRLAAGALDYLQKLDSLPLATFESVANFYTGQASARQKAQAHRELALTKNSSSNRRRKIPSHDQALALFETSYKELNPQAQVLFRDPSGKSGDLEPALMRADLDRLGMPSLSPHSRRPDLVFYDATDRKLVVVEVVHRSNPWTPDRLHELSHFLSSAQAAGQNISLVTVFTSPQLAKATDYKLAPDTWVWTPQWQTDTPYNALRPATPSPVPVLSLASPQPKGLVY